ncbi:T9SS C-terminal target domain-containing protein [Chryseotalea sanaruensis]|uniref:T9SS C-terminal target domain-containing protein n=2 Tax=Chryseotalea sanaruensis TaxID=2482724 RepID=A0A401UDA5_9BACT|nr:T9SS C-terminal target domain-containing protein [Chryseotalea sanaruensis]
MAEDSTLYMLGIKKVQTENIPSILFDSIKQQKWLLVMDDADHFSYRAPLNDGAAKTSGAFNLVNPLGSFQLSGKGINCGVWDDGLVKDHIEFGNRILSKEGNDFESHATHVTGTILAAGVNPLARGMAPQASAFTYYFNNDISEMSVAANNDKPLLFSNHSYGAVTGWSLRNGTWTWFGDPEISIDEDYRHGFYGQRTKNIDALAYLSPYYTIVWAAGNDRFDTGSGTQPADCNRGTGYDCIISDAVGKNIITVGAVQKVANYTSPASVVMSHFSSWGPTDDGRIKPDLVAAGMDVFSTNANGTNGYEFSTGTSMATPGVTGSLILLQELYAKLNAGKFMKAATLKALAIHTAKEAGPKPGPDYQFGWGLIDVKAGADFLIAENYIDKLLVEERLLNNANYELTIQPQVNKKISITLSWTDPEGTPVSASLDPLDRMLVNDLDVRLIDEDGLITLPWSLNPSVPQAQAIQADNSRDNVEKIELSNPLNKSYKILVRHKGELRHGHQDFSLVVSYESQGTNSKTFYWIGNTGNWQDASNWSFASSGSAANQLPTGNDVIIIDELSLNKEDTIRLTDNASVGQIKWLCNKKTFLDLKSNTLAISKALTLASDSAKVIGAGILSFSTSQQGVIHFTDSDLNDTDLSFQSGNWSVDGFFKAGHVEINNGSHQWAMLKSDITSLTAANTTTLDISNVELTISEALSLASTITFKADNAILLISDNDVQLSLGSNNFNGEIRITGGNILLSGEGRITQLTCTSSLTTNGSPEFETLHLLDGAQWTLADGTEQQLHTLAVNTTTLLPCLIKSEGGATINFVEHKILCVDNLNVSNVSATGLGIINVGTSGQIENAANWLTLPCEQVLFADFEANFACVNGLTSFTDTSLGNPNTWEWTFSDPLNNTRDSNMQNPILSFESVGSVSIGLTVTKDQQSHTFSRTIAINDNPLPENDILLSPSGSLISLLMTNNYHWYLNREIIENAFARELTDNQQPGLYEVLISNGTCNRLSSPYLVSAINEDSPSSHLYPNPANEYFSFKTEALLPQTAYLYNNLGLLLKSVDITMPVLVKDLPNGLYFVKVVHTTGSITLEKLIISHQ